jgi:hypothetical protein
MQRPEDIAPSAFEDEEGGDEVSDTMCVVALYDFDPSTIEWPFRRQRPLALQTGRVIKVIHDDGSEWPLGQPIGQPDVKGYFPKNYTVTVAEYREMMRDYQDPGEGEPGEGEFAGGGFFDQPPEGVELPPMPTGPDSFDPGMSPLEEEFEEEDNRALSEEAIYEEDNEYLDDMGPYSVQDPAPRTDAATTHDPRAADNTLGRTAASATRPQEEAPRVPRTVPHGAGPPAEDMAAALSEAQRDRREMEMDSTYVPKAKAKAMGGPSDSRTSTPATQNMERPDKNFVRRHLPMELQDRYLRKLSKVGSLIKQDPKVIYADKPAFPIDSRVRATTCRTAHGIEPPHLRMALSRSAVAGARWTQMFRPGFNDIVNESFKGGCNAMILSRLYLSDAQAREQFQRLHVKDTNGTLWFELQRRKEYLFYQRMDQVDVMMWHPDAWGFPDTSLAVSALPGEPFDPMHGWWYQKEIDTEKEMDNVEFCYNLRQRMFDVNTFQAIALGKVPEWIKAAGGFGLDDEENEDDEDAGKTGMDFESTTGDVTQENFYQSKGGRGPKVILDQTMLDNAGLGEASDTLKTVEELDIDFGSADSPEVLDARKYSYRIRGIPALRVFLRSRGNPDNTKQTQITPKIVKDMAAQLGIKGQFANYWYCLFAIRYPLAPEWEVYVKNDTRWYLHLPSDKVQCLHPMITRFREHMTDCLTNEFLCDFRGFVTMKCSDCGIPDAVVWCMQCTDYFCTACFFKTHGSKSGRGKKHWPMPIPGSRYLLRTEVERLREHLPLLNVGFSNRRRFLATENQSDKNGSRSGDTWLFFEADTFQSALVQAPRSHWFIKRLTPPRLSPDAKGYYYNFASEVLSDEPTHIMSKQHEQKALTVLQRNIKGAITRKHIKKEIAAARIIQKCKVMWDCKQMYGDDGKNRVTLQAWYRKFRAKQDRVKLEYRVTRCQAAARGNSARKFVREMIDGITCFQSHFRGLRGRRHMAVLSTAASTIQRMYRGHLMGRKPMHDMHVTGGKIQALSRGVAYRENERRKARKATYIQGRWKGVSTRKMVARMKKSATMIQTNWRRFQGQLHLKLILYDRLDTLRSKYMELMRFKIQGASATLIQRNWRRHVDSEQVVYMKLEKSEADKRIQTLLVAMYAAAGSMRHHVHPWWRHLPPELQEVLEQIKGSLQRTIALVPVTGKLASEEIGKKGLRVADQKHLTYVQVGQDPDLASHLFLSVTRHLLSLVPAELFPATVRWACYAIGHQAAALVNDGAYSKDIVSIGKDQPPHPGDRLDTLWGDTGMIRHHHDWLMTYSDESVPTLVLHGLTPQLRQVYLTAQVLITMRQALDTPTLSTDDHLKFQGLDATSGAQLMEVLSCEMDHRWAGDLPTKHGTVASLSAQIGELVTKLTARKEVDVPKQGVAKKKAKKAVEAVAQPKGKAKGKAKGKSKAAPTAPKEMKTEVDDDVEETIKPVAVAEIETGGVLLNFNRRAMLRILQQVGYFMRGQDALVEAVLADGKQGLDETPNVMSVRQSRYVSVTDKLFELADTAKHDHCSFVLAVVLFHMALRALCLRVLYHRAAISIQKRYRYLKQKGAKSLVLGPAKAIQRFWRGTRASLHITRWDNAAAKIQHTYKVYRWNLRAEILLQATLRIQRVWLGAIHRKWLRSCHSSATYIQKIVRAVQVRLVLTKQNRELARTFQLDMNNLLKEKSSVSETLYVARTAALAGKLRANLAKQRDIDIDMRRMPLHAVNTTAAHQIDKAKRMTMKGSVQPMRISEFEPMVFALAKMDAKLPARYGARKSKVLDLVIETKKELDKTLPRDSARRPHAGAKRGRAAIIARRLGKKPKIVDDASGPILDEELINRWALQQFEPKRL